METPTLDHVALRVADRCAIEAQLLDALDVAVLDRTDTFTLLGPAFGSGMVTLLDAEVATAPERIVSLVLASGSAEAVPPLQLADGLVVTFAPDDTGTAPRHALVGVSLRATDPPLVAAEMEAIHGLRVGSAQRDVAVVDVGSASRAAHLTLSRERWRRCDDDRGMLDHIGLRVDDAEAWRARAQSAGLDVVRWVEGPRSRAVFVSGPDGLLLEYVEHRAGAGAP